MNTLSSVIIMARTAKKIKAGDTVTVQTYTPDLFCDSFLKKKKLTCKVYNISEPWAWGFNGKKPKKQQVCYLYFYANE